MPTYAGTAIRETHGSREDSRVFFSRGTGKTPRSAIPFRLEHRFRHARASSGCVDIPSLAYTITKRRRLRSDEQSVRGKSFLCYKKRSENILSSDSAVSIFCHSVS